MYKFSLEDLWDIPQQEAEKLSIDDLDENSISSCSCTVCKRMCRNPCIPTPTEASEIEAKGFSLTERNYEGRIVRMPSTTLEFRCEFQDKDGLCKLHKAGVKPKEAKLVSCQDDFYKILNVRDLILQEWEKEEE